ncbi:MAG: hypothetical protein H7315_08980 [Herminiimonas sp.]|nr:hypothetical protein [Herminiimonas sp.]
MPDAKPVAAKPVASPETTPGAASQSKPVSKPAARSATKVASKSTAEPAAKSAVKLAIKSAVGADVRAAATANGVTPPASAKTAKASPKVKIDAELKVKKAKLVRDSFTMPDVEYQVLADMKKAALKAGFEIKKSELLRIGVALIQKTDIEKLRSMLAALSPLKAGRPKNEK